MANIKIVPAQPGWVAAFAVEDTMVRAPVIAWGIGPACFKPRPITAYGLTEFQSLYLVRDGESPWRNPQNTAWRGQSDADAAIELGVTPVPPPPPICG